MQGRVQSAKHRLKLLMLLLIDLKLGMVESVESFEWGCKEVESITEVALVLLCPYFTLECPDRNEQRTLKKIQNCLI